MKEKKSILKKQIYIDDNQVTIEKKNIKNIYIRVLSPDGRVVVTMPRQMTDDRAVAFVRGKKQWIKQKQSEITNRPDLVLPYYEEGEKLWLWGREYPLVIADGCRNCISYNRENIILTQNRLLTREEKTALFIKWYRCILYRELDIVSKQSETITGIKAREWRIKLMKTKWGSCNIGEKRIWINLQLVKFPQECLHCVCIHELVHLYEYNHNQHFKKLMDQFYPEWKKINMILSGKQ